ncbi:hypothetical protein SUGI_1143570 [Cryptomeria japonica]|nr:hypothetical protein SUGI_1143570 [Cryptomeria japonica]
MPFGLKNVGVTYQRAMTTIFHDMMHTMMEDYVDDLLAKSLTREGHLNIIDKIFDRLEQYHVQLNPKKCVFRVTSRKLLGYIVSSKGIEVDPAKVKEIMDMPPANNISQLRTLQGWLQSIRRFIAQLVDKCHPFTHLLHKNICFQWDARCQQAFQMLKHYLMNTPLLIPPNPSRPLLLYISATSVAFGVLLAQHNAEGKDYVVYYIS